MTGFLAAIVALTLCGLLLAAIPYVRSLDVAARLAVAFAGGMLLASALMFALAALHGSWSRTLLFGGLVPLALVGLILFVRGDRPQATGDRAATRFAFFIPIVFTAIGVFTGRETCSDLIHFWGPKGIHFWIARTIDTDFLGYTFYFLMHPDYPPLLTLVYAWGATVAHHFSWWGAIALMPIMLLATAAAFRGMAARALGAAAANRQALLLASVLALAFEIGPVAGVGEPPIVLFVTIAIAALTFAPDDRGAMLLASLMLAAAAFTKVEGAAFAIVILAVFLVTRRRIAAPLLMAIIPTLLLGGWILFAKKHGLLDAYAGREHVHLRVLPEIFKGMLREASYGTYYLPWLALIAVMAFGERNWRRAALPLLVTAGTTAAIVFFYLHSTDPSFWIASSATRVLLVPLASFAVATAAMSE
jgi:hypothetical protein